MFWGMRFAPFSHKTALNRRLVLFRLFRVKTARSHTAITSMVASSYRSRKSLRIVIRVANQLRIKRKIAIFRHCGGESLPFRHTERSEVSKSCESKTNNESMTQKQISESHRFAKNQRIIGDSQVAKMDYSFHGSRVSLKNDKSLIPSSQGRICGFARSVCAKHRPTLANPK